MAASVASPLPALRQGSSVCAPHAMASSPYTSSSMSSSVSSLKAGAGSKGGLYGIKELKCAKKPSSTSVPQQGRTVLTTGSMADPGEFVSEEPPTPLLDTVNFPIHIKNLNKKV
jgi:hypothetical protein